MKIDRMHAIDAVTINPHVITIHQFLSVIITITATRVRTTCCHFQNNLLVNRASLVLLSFAAMLQYNTSGLL